MTRQRKADSSTTDAGVLLEFMYRLGQAYLACGEQTALVELFLRRVAAAQGMRQSRVVALPTAIFIIFNNGVEDRLTLAEGPLQTLRLDQIANVYSLGDQAADGLIAPQEGLEKLTAILRQPARFGQAGVVIGHTILTIGLALVIQPTMANVAAAAVLGLLVGLLRMFNRNRPVLSAPLPVVGAALVSTLVFVALKWGLPIDPRYTLIPPLVSFLPGAMLTFGMVELAYGDMVSGSSRLVTGFVQLVLLAFGLAVGAALVGYSPNNLLDAANERETTRWSPWLGVIVFGFGAYFYHSAPRYSLLWVLLVLLVAFAAQQIASDFFNTEISGFFGTLVATPLGYLIQQRFRGPPSMVTFLPSFWLLVPGSLGLVSVKTLLTDRSAGIDGLVSALFAIASIALGTLVGAALYKWLTETFGWWQLQIGRVGRYFQRKWTG